MVLVREYLKDTAGIDENIAQWFYFYGCQSQANSSVASIAPSLLCTRWDRCIASMTFGFSLLSVDHFVQEQVCLLSRLSLMYSD